MPACSAAFASWIARTSFCVIASSARRRRGRRRTCGRRRRRGQRRREGAVDRAVGGDDPGEVHLGDHLDDPGSADAGARRVSARSRVVGPQVGPITGSAARAWRGSMRTRSIAPGAARWPQLICAPSNAGPVGLERGEQPWRLPSTISAFVPTSTSRVMSSVRSGPRRESCRRRPRRRDRRCRAARRPSRRVHAMPISAAGRSRRVDGERERGAAELDRIDAEQQVMHDRVADER